MVGVDFAKLRTKGWSEAEVGHAKKILEHAETTKHAHVRHWEYTLLFLLVIFGVVGTAGLVLFVFPVFLFASIFIALPVLFLVGAAFGMLLTSALRSLQAAPHHHVAGMSLLMLFSLATATIIIALLERRFTMAPGIHFSSPPLLAAALVIGMIMPYLLERRLHGAQ